MFWYRMIVSFASFVVCYRIEPPKNQRSKNLDMWTLQSNEKITRAEIDKLYTKLTKDVETQMSSLQKLIVDQKNRDEQEMMRQMEAEMRAAEEAKKREQDRIKEEEEYRSLKVEMESHRKAQELESLRLEAEHLIHPHKQALKMQMEEAGKAVTKQNNLEQERRDHEMAVRLAKETNGHVEGSPPQLHRSELVKMQQPMQGEQKYDLSKWRFSELRDVINTSRDNVVLEVFRHEYHRRLKVYHAWMGKHARKTTMADQEGAPQFIMDAAPCLPLKGENLNARHRYFRIPFVECGAPFGEPERRGWWYAHFDGQYVARLMELHPDKTPVLLQSGVNDMQMFKLSLEERGLTRKRGVEMLEHDFEREWARQGGPTYVAHDAHKR